VAFDDPANHANDISNGFWIIHSLPRFPQMATNQHPSQFTVRHDNTPNYRGHGQAAMCVNLANKGIKVPDIMKHLLRSRAFIIRQNFFPVPNAYPALDYKFERFYKPPNNNNNNNNNLCTSFGFVWSNNPQIPGTSFDMQQSTNQDTVVLSKFGGKCDSNQLCTDMWEMVAEKLQVHLWIRTWNAVCCLPLFQ
jgi:hypothetical protein